MSPETEPLKKAEAHSAGPESVLRPLLAEAVGTFAGTFVAAGGIVIDALSGGAVGMPAVALARGLTVMALIYALGNDSGAHYNPAVTLAFALRGVFPWRWVPAYWVVQFASAVGAALLLAALFGNIKDLGATHAHFGTTSALVMEILLTCLLNLVILGTATRYSLIGTNAAIAVGAITAVSPLFAAPVSGASMNPARSLGPAVISGAVGDLWIYFVGPFTGAALAYVLTGLLHPGRHSSEKEVAQGDHLGTKGKESRD